MKAEAISWTKYMELEGLRIIMDPKNAQMVPNPKTQQASALAMKSGVDAKKWAVEFLNLIGAIKQLFTTVKSEGSGKQTAN